jgi:hypothetical protein
MEEMEVKRRRRRRRKTLVDYLKTRKRYSHLKEEALEWTMWRSLCGRFNEQRNILHEIRKRKANWIGHILRRINLLKYVNEGKVKKRWKGKDDDEEHVGSYWMTL